MRELKQKITSTIDSVNKYVHMHIRICILTYSSDICLFLTYLYVVHSSCFRLILCDIPEN